MTYPLTTRLIADFDDAFIEDMMLVNRLCVEGKDAQIAASHSIWKDTISEHGVLNYSTALYLNKQYFEGKLHSTLFRFSPAPKLTAYIYKQLAITGVFALNGQVSTIECRSFLECAIAIDERTVECFIDMLAYLHHDGFTVTATHVKDTTALYQVIFTTEGFQYRNRCLPIEEVKDLHDLALKLNPTFGRLHHAGVNCRLHDPLITLDRFNQVFTFDTPHYFICSIWNTDWDNKQADQALLQRWFWFVYQHLHMHPIG